MEKISRRNFFIEMKTPDMTRDSTRIVNALPRRLTDILGVSAYDRE